MHFTNRNGWFGLGRAVSLALVSCLLTTSTPAAPQTLVAVAKESHIAFAFWFRGSRLEKLIQGRGNPTAKNQQKQSERDAKIVRLQIFPGDVAISPGERVRFSAVAYDSENNAIGGAKINWSGQSSAPGRRVRLTPHGEFEGVTAGKFTIVAETGGNTAQVTVTVRPGPLRNPKQRPTATRQVSTRDAAPARIGSVKQTNTSEDTASLQVKRGNKRNGRVASTRQAHAVKPFLPGDGWDDTNFRTADDPGNGVGNPPGAPLDGGAGSGNFQFAAPVVSLPGRGIGISLGLAYNSRLWNKAGTQISYDNDRGWPAPGFNLGFGKMLGMGVNNGCMLVDADGTRHSYTGEITFYSWGTRGIMHTTDGSFIDYEYWSGTNGVITSARAQLPNGTVITYGAFSQSGGGVFPTNITDANGNYITITYVNNAGPHIRTVADTLNRTITFHYNSNSLLTAITGPGLNGGTRTLVRLLYHQLSLDYSGFNLTPSVRNSSPWVIDTIYYPATGTGYWLNDSDSYSTFGMIRKVSERRNMAFSGPEPVPPIQGPTEQGTITSAGLITREESYNYPAYVGDQNNTSSTNLADAPTYTSMTESWTRDGAIIDSATTTYEVHQDETPRRTIITLPNGTKSKQLSYHRPDQYDDGLVFHDETYVTEGQPLQSSDSSWQPGAYGSPRPWRVEKRDERGQLTVAEFSYGSAYNQLTEVRDFDYGGSALLRATRTEYENNDAYTGHSTTNGYVGRHIFNLPLNVEVFAADNVTRVSHTDYQYDQAVPSAAPNVLQHYPSYNPHAAAEGFCSYEEDFNDPDCTGECSPETPCDGNCPQIYNCPYDSATNYRGNVTQVTSYANANNLSGAVTETRRYDVTGNLVTASSSCCEQTSFNYTVDTQYAYPQATTRGSATDPYTQVSSSATYDFNTGLGKTATDANGRTSQASYDPSTLRPTSTISPTGAHTDLAYDDTEMTVTATTYLATGGIADQNVKLLNGRGQVRQEQALGTGVWDLVDTVYDNMGQVAQQSRPYRSGASPVFSIATFDALGRVNRVTAPDGSVTETYYNEVDFDGSDGYTPQRPNVASSSSGETTLVRDAWGRERWGRTDASGRLVEVVEPNPNGNGSVAAGGLVTTYAYNTLGNLTTINQEAQTRSFAYDSLGRLTAQKLAEVNATLNDAGSYVGVGGSGAAWGDVFAYDNRSNLISRTDARGVKTVYSYFINGDPNFPDPLNRLQSVSWDTTGFGDTANPIFAAAAVSYEYRTKGSPTDSKDITQLASVTTAGVSSETYGFDPEGRVESKTLSLTTRPNYPFVIDYDYDSLDRVTDVLYPKQWGNGSAPRKAVHHDYDVASRLSSLTYDGQSFASNFVYNAASQTTSLNVGNGANQITESYSYNAQTGLLDNQTVARGATTLLDLSYDYANASGKRTGQLTKLLNNLNHNKDRGYSYDALGRLVQATGGVNGALWTQNYSYDRYGNRLSVSATGSSAKNKSRDAGADVSSALSAQRNRSVSEPRAAVTGSLLQPAEPTVDLPTDLLARNNSVPGGNPTVREGAESLSDSAPKLRGTGEDARAPSTATLPPQSGPPVFTDDPLKDPNNPESFKIKALHINELRTWINALRVKRGLSNYPWTKPLNTQGVVAPGNPVSADPIIEMRIALDQAIGSPAEGYSADLAQGQLIRAIHIQELRKRVKDNWDSGCLTIDQYIQSFYQGALARQPYPSEWQSWSSQLRQAYYQGHLLAAVQYMGRQLFKSQEYANRGRNDHWYVSDLYWAYLQREPDAPGWAYWENVIYSDNQQGLNGREHARAAFESDTFEFAPKVASLCVGSSSSSTMSLDGLATLSYNPATNRITTAGFEYDAAGNQTRIVRAEGSAQRYKYDAANRLIQVRDDYGYILETLTYGDSNQRLISDQGGWRTYFACEGGATIAEYYESSGSSTPLWSKSYVYMAGRLLSTLAPNGSGGEAIQLHHPDRLGTRLVTDPQNATSLEQVALPFGTALNAESTVETNRRFTSYDRSATTGLDYANNRQYDSQQGRFTQVDPAGMNATNPASPQTLNLYAYCANDPINRTDPSGLGLVSFLKKVVKRVIHAAIHAAFTFLSALLFTGSVHAAFIAAVVDFFKELGLPSKGPFPGSPQWNPNAHPIIGGGIGPLSRYIIVNFQQVQDPVWEVVAISILESKSAKIAALMRRIKEALCRRVPSGRTSGVQLSMGAKAGPTGGVEVVQNFRSGQTSAFAFGGGQVGVPGGLSAQANTGFIWGSLKDDNSNYSGPFAGASGSYGTFGGFVQSGSGLTVIGGSAGVSLTPFTATAGITTYTKPLSLGRWWYQVLNDNGIDRPLILANQVCR